MPPHGKARQKGARNNQQGVSQSARGGGGGQTGLKANEIDRAEQISQSPYLKARKPDTSIGYVHGVAKTNYPNDGQTMWSQINSKTSGQSERLLHSEESNLKHHGSLTSDTGANQGSLGSVKNKNTVRNARLKNSTSNDDKRESTGGMSQTTNLNFGIPNNHKSVQSGGEPQYMWLQNSEKDNYSLYTVTKVDVEGVSDPWTLEDSVAPIGGEFKSAMDSVSSRNVRVCQNKPPPKSDATTTHPSTTGSASYPRGDATHPSTTGVAHSGATPGVIEIPPGSQIVYVSPEELNAMEPSLREYHMLLANRGASLLGMPPCFFVNNDTGGIHGNFDMGMPRMPEMFPDAHGHHHHPHPHPHAHIPMPPLQMTGASPVHASKPRIPQAQDIPVTLQQAPNVRDSALLDDGPGQPISINHSILNLNNKTEIPEKEGAVEEKTPPSISILKGKPQEPDLPIMYKQRGSLNDQLVADYSNGQDLLPLSLPDMLNYYLKINNILPSPDNSDLLIQRLETIHELSINGSLAPLKPMDELILPTSSMDIRPFGMTNHSGDNLCYRNTAVQALLSIPTLMRYILASGSCPSPTYYPAHAALYHLGLYGLGLQYEHSSSFCDKVKAIALDESDQEPTPGMVSSVNPDVYMKPLMNLWKKNQNRGDAEQEDAEEFLSFIFTQLGTEVSWKGDRDDTTTVDWAGSKVSLSVASGLNDISQLFFGMVFRSVKKDQNDKVSIAEHQESTWRVSLGEFGASTELNLGSFLGKYLTNDKEFDYRDKFSHIPEVLIIHLYRVEFADNRATKIKTPVTPPLSLGLPNDYLVNPQDDDIDIKNIVNIQSDNQKMAIKSGVIYELKAAINHEGENVLSGHYSVHCQRGNKVYRIEDLKLTASNYQTDCNVLIYTRCENYVAVKLPKSVE